MKRHVVLEISQHCRTSVHQYVRNVSRFNKYTVSHQFIYANTRFNNIRIHIVINLRLTRVEALVYMFIVVTLSQVYQLGSNCISDCVLLIVT